MMSGGFSFGAKTTTPAFGQSNFGTQPTGSITFGTPVASNTTTGAFGTNTQATSLFGTPTPNVSAAATGLSFGSTGTGFGLGAPASSAANTSFSFATPTSSVQSTGLSFGAPTSAPGGLAFGSATPQASTGLSFGAPSTGLSFGTPSTGLSFGAAPSAITPSGLSFGTATTFSGLSFGAPAPTASTGFSLSTPASTVPANLTFGAPASSAPSSGLTFGGTSGGSVSFGATKSTGPSLGLNFGTTTTSGNVLNFAAPASTAATGLGFGLGTSASQPAALSFGTSTSQPAALSFGTSTSQPAALSFGTSTAQPAALSFGTSTSQPAALSFGTSTSQPAALSFGLGGLSTSLNLTTKPTTTPSAGLGGIATSTPKVTTSTTGKPEILPRDQTLPNEILQTVENFKNFVKQQKNYSSDVARCSVKEFKKVAAEIDLVSSLLNEAENHLQSNRAVVEKLKHDTAKGLQHVEMAQRTYDTPPGLQYDNTAPLYFFMELVDSFEKEMQSLKIQIENTDKYVKNLDQPTPLNSQDLALGMRRLHETFVALAGRLQAVHSQVETQKEQYLNLRKYMMNDDSNVFEKLTKQEDALQIALHSITYKPPTLATGPTPFHSMGHTSVLQAAAQNQLPAPTPGTSFGVGSTQISGFGSQPPTQNIFGSTPGATSFGQPSLQFSSPSSSFQLQKPPVGNKRGKQ